MLDGLNVTKSIKAGAYERENEEKNTHTTRKHM